MTVFSLPTSLMRARILGDLVGVEAARRLVQDEDVGVVQHGLRQADALPVTLGQLAYQLAGYLGKPAPASDLLDAAVDPVAAHAVHVGGEL